MSASAESGYERATVTRAARTWSWVLLIVLLIGCFGGALLDSAPLQNWLMRLGTILLLVGYVVLSRRAARESGVVLVRGLPRGAWSAILVILAYVVLAGAYAPLDHPLFGTHSMVSHFDQYVPTIPVFVLPYQGMYVGIVASLGFFAYRLLHRQLRTLAASFVISMFIAESTFVLFQTEGTAAVRDAGNYGGFFGGMLEYVNVAYYHNDNFSTFPSMHCAYATLFAIAWYRLRNPLWSGLVITFSVLIVIATQVLHEHVLMDAVYGIVIGTLAYSLAWFWFEYRPALVRERMTASSVG